MRAALVVTAGIVAALALGCSAPADAGPVQCQIERCYPDFYACDRGVIGTVVGCADAQSITWNAGSELGSCQYNPVPCAAGAVCLVNGNAVGTCVGQ